jgi:hypothetical protein
MLLPLTVLPRPRLEWGHPALGWRQVPPLDIAHRALLVESSGREKSTVTWRAHREATVTARSIVGDHSLGVRTRRPAQLLTYFRCRKIGYEEETTENPVLARSGAAVRPPRPPRPKSVSGRADCVTELGLLVYRPRETRRPKGHRGREAQWSAEVESPDSGSSSDAPIEPGAHGVPDTSMNPIVLVSRVTIGRPGALRLRKRRANTRSVPLPFFMTIPVSFERGENSSVRAHTSIALHDRRHARQAQPRGFGSK